MSDLLLFLQSSDTRLMYFLNVSLRNPVFNWVMPVFDYDAAWRLPLIVGWLAVMIFGKRRGRLIGLGALALILITDPVSSRLIKPWVGRIRPCNLLPGLNMWKDGAWIVIPDPITQVYRASLSMPSSHAVNTGGQALWWGWAYPRWRWWFWGLAVTIGYSRIYDGMHFPFDVAVGWVVGAGCFLVVGFTFKRWIPGFKPAAASHTRSEV